MFVLVFVCVLFLVEHDCFLVLFFLMILSLAKMDDSKQGFISLFSRVNRV